MRSRRSGYYEPRNDSGYDGDKRTYTDYETDYYADCDDYDDHDDGRIRDDDGYRCGRRRSGGRCSGGSLIPIVLLIVILACGITAGRDLWNYYAAQHEYAVIDRELINTGSLDTEDIYTEPIPAADWYPALDIDYAGYEDINEDFVGVLYFPTLNIRYPVAISQNNIEYLTTTFEGSTNPSGCIFMDYQNQRNWQDRNTYIYGHNMRDGSMFGRLKDLVQDDSMLTGDARWIYVYTEDRIMQYQVFCVEVAPSESNFGNIHTDSQYDTYIGEIRERAWYWDDAVDLTERPDMITLYTCYGSGHTQKLLVHAALMNETT